MIETLNQLGAALAQPNAADVEFMLAFLATRCRCHYLALRA